MREKPFKLGDRVRRRDEHNGSVGEVTGPISDYIVGVRWSPVDWALERAVEMALVIEESE